MMPIGTLSFASSRALYAAAARSRACPQARKAIGRNRDQHLRALGRDEVADDAREPRRAVVLAREPDRHADREQQAEIREDRIAGRRDRRDVEQVRLPEAQQQPRDRQHRDRQHERAAELLQASREVASWRPPVHCAGRWRRRTRRRSIARTRPPIQLERALRELAAFLDRAVRTMRFQPRNDRGHGGDLVHAEADQDRHRMRRPRRARRTPRRSCRVRAPPRPRRAINRSTAGCSASRLPGELGMAAIDRERVLRQVVGADRQEIRVIGELLGEQRGGRCLDHHAERQGRSTPSSRAHLVEHARARGGPPRCR